MFGLDRRVIANFDWLLFGLTVIIAGVGVINLYSATAETGIYMRQIYWLGLGLGAMLLVVAIPYQRLEKAAPFLYFLNLAALAAVLVMGKTSGGSQRWLVVGPIHIQPSETMKLILILVLARYCHRREGTGAFGFKELILPLVLIALPAGLIVKEPDLGTGLLIVAIGGSVLLFNGIRLQTLGLLVAGGIGLGAVGWGHLKPYQKQRVLTFFDPEGDPLGAGYHVIQSKIAVGSGQLWGKGYMAGTQSQLKFIPEHHTDFAFSVLAEEWGLIGGLVVVALFGLLLFWGLNIAYHSKDGFARLVAVGITTVFFWQVVINIGMVTGLLPVVGIPLPFVSYGGSSAVVNLMALGLLMNVSMRRFVFTR